MGNNDIGSFSRAVASEGMAVVFDSLKQKEATEEPEGIKNENQLSG